MVSRLRLVRRLREDNHEIDPRAAMRIVGDLQREVAEDPAAWAAVADRARRSAGRHREQADRLLRLAALIEAVVQDSDGG